jgi:hypothetical protein
VKARHLIRAKLGDMALYVISSISESLESVRGQNPSKNLFLPYRVQRLWRGSTQKLKSLSSATSGDVESNSLSVRATKRKGGSLGKAQHGKWHRDFNARGLDDIAEHRRRSRVGRVTNDAGLPVKLGEISTHYLNEIKVADVKRSKMAARADEVWAGNVGRTANDEQSDECCVPPWAIGNDCKKAIDVILYLSISNRRRQRGNYIQQASAQRRRTSWLSGGCNPSSAPGLISKSTPACWRPWAHQEKQQAIMVTGDFAGLTQRTRGFWGGEWRGLNSNSW